jgi:hypothetical protein
LMPEILISTPVITELNPNTAHPPIATGVPVSCPHAVHRSNTVSSNQVSTSRVACLSRRTTALTRPRRVNASISSDSIAALVQRLILSSFRANGAAVVHAHGGTIPGVWGSSNHGSRRDLTGREISVGPLCHPWAITDGGAGTGNLTVRNGTRRHAVANRGVP